jgi:hypothetical protein
MKQDLEARDAQSYRIKQPRNFSRRLTVPTPKLRK